MISMSSSQATILSHIRKMQKKQTQLSGQEHPEEEEEEEKRAKFGRYNKIHNDVHHNKPTFQRQQSTFSYINQRIGHPKKQKITSNMMYTSNPTKSYALIKQDLYVAGDNFEPQWKKSKKQSQSLVQEQPKKKGRRRRRRGGPA